MTPKRDSELSAASGAYALGALGEPEKSEFEALMTVSEGLRAEVVELSDTAVELGLSVAPEAPSPEFRASLMALVAQTAQLAPEDDIATEPGSPEVTPTPALVPVAGAAEKRAQARWFQRPVGTLVAAAAAVMLIAGIGFGANTVLQAQGDMATAAQINQIQAADDYKRASADVAGGGGATLVWSDQLRRSALIVDGVRGLPAGSTYELWYIDGDNHATPAGTFDVTEGATHTVVLEGDMSKGDRVGVTIEPAGGSEKPSGTPVVLVATA